MTIIQKIELFLKKKFSFFSTLDLKIIHLRKFNLFFLIFFVIIFSSFFFISSNIINQKNDSDKKNFNELTKSSEFSNLSNFLISKINSPYREVNYIIENNDSVEKIPRKFEVKDNEIKKISNKLKERNFNNIYSGRKLNLIVKKLEDGSNAVINFVYPINNTTSIEIRKYQNTFKIIENVLQLYKKEVVVKNIIKNNLYSSAKCRCRAKYNYRICENIWF